MCKNGVEGGNDFDTDECGGSDGNGGGRGGGTDERRHGEEGKGKDGGVWRGGRELSTMGCGGKAVGHVGKSDVC